MKLQTLIRILNEETKLHEQLFALKENERRYIIAMNAQALLDNTTELSNLTEELQSLETYRHNLTEEIAFSYGVENEKSITLQELLDVVPTQERAELESAGKLLKTVALKVRDSNQKNRRLMQLSTETINANLTYMVKQHDSGVYTRSGAKNKNGVPRAGLNIQA